MSGLAAVPGVWTALRSRGGAQRGSGLSPSAWAARPPVTANTPAPTLRRLEGRGCQTKGHPMAGNGYPPGYGPPTGLQHRIPRHPDYYYLRAAGGFYLWHQGRYFGRDHFVQAFATFADMADHVDRVDPR